MYFKRQKSIGDLAIRAKVPKALNLRPKRVINGMKKCGKNCPICPFIKEGREVKIKNGKWFISPR